MLLRIPLLTCCHNVICSTHLLSGRGLARGKLGGKEEAEHFQDRDGENPLEDAADNNDPAVSSIRGPQKSLGCRFFWCPCPWHCPLGGSDLDRLTPPPPLVSLSSRQLERTEQPLWFLYFSNVREYTSNNTTNCVLSKEVKNIL